MCILNVTFLLWRCQILQVNVRTVAYLLTLMVMFPLIWQLLKTMGGTCGLDFFTICLLTLFVVFWFVVSFIIWVIVIISPFSASVIIFNRLKSVISWSSAGIGFSGSNGTMTLAGGMFYFIATAFSDGHGGRAGGCTKPVCTSVFVTIFGAAVVVAMHY